MTISPASWWGGEWNWTAGLPEMTVFNLYWYQDNPDLCKPVSDLFMTLFGLTPTRMFLEYDPFGWPVYKYDASVEVHIVGQQQYWFVDQAAA